MQQKKKKKKKQDYPPIYIASISVSINVKTMQVLELRSSTLKIALKIEALAAGVGGGLQYSSRRKEEGEII